MKLYAKLKNSKGKIEGVGDNEVLIIELSKGNKVIGEIFFDSEGFIVRAEGKEVLDYELNDKGNITCECGNKFYGLEGKEDTCPPCLKEIIQKGKDLKGERCIHDWDNYGKCCICGKWNT